MPKHIVDEINLSYLKNDLLFLVFDTFMHFYRYESCIDVEIQQRAAEYLALSRKGEALVDILAEMPKFPERKVSSIYFLILTINPLSKREDQICY